MDRDDKMGSDWRPVADLPLANRRHSRAIGRRERPTPADRQGVRQSTRKGSWIAASGLLVAALLATTGCQPTTAPAVAPAPPMVVPVSQPVPREVTDYVDFTGRVNAIQSVDIRPRVTGYLRRMPFKEGAEVKAGDVLFEVDPRPYLAQVEAYRAELGLYQAQLKVARTVYNRDVGVNTRVPNSI